MTKTNDGGPAFPHDNQELGDRHRVAQPGMTLRDWFAGQALVGLMSDPGLRPDKLAEFQHMAVRLYQVADAMLAERERGK